MNKALLLVSALLAARCLFAKPEYAVKNHINCTACHVNAWGGGPRNVYGKIYGAHGFTAGKFSQQDTFAASLRGIAYYPKDISQNSNGLAIMEASVSANVPVVEAGEETSEVRVVGTFNASPLQTGLREGYARINPYGSKNTFITAGRFNPPFGLMTDEHRTYTKMQTATTINTFDTGGAISGDIFTDLYYDLALVTNIQGSSGFIAQGGQYGAILNLRWMPGFAPFLFGASQNIQHIDNQPEPYATSLYGVFSFDRFTEGKLPASFLIEAVTARNWNGTNINGGLSSFFIPSADSAYQSAVGSSQSLGIYAMLRYDITQSLNVFYKWDSLTLDTNYFGDVFLRSGFGAEIALNSNTYLNARIERADVTRPEISGTNVLGSQSDFIAMLRVWL